MRRMSATRSISELRDRANGRPIGPIAANTSYMGCQATDREMLIGAAATPAVVDRTIDIHQFCLMISVKSSHWPARAVASLRLAGYEASAGFGYFVGDFAVFVDFFFILSGVVI